MYTVEVPEFQGLIGRMLETVLGIGQESFLI